MGAAVQEVLEKVACPNTVEALSPLERVGPANSRTLLSPRSATHRFPDVSNAVPCGTQTTLEGREPQLSLTKSGSPITMDALSPLVNEGPANSSTLSLPVSATHRSPEWSKASPSGTQSSPCVMEQGGWLVKSGAPITLEALSPVVKDGPENSRMRSKLESETQRLCDESKASPSGSQRPAWVGVVGHTALTRSDCPIATDALSPVVKDGPGNIRTLLFPASATQRFPDESNAIAEGAQSVFTVGTQTPFASVVPPMSTEAAPPSA